MEQFFTEVKGRIKQHNGVSLVEGDRFRWKNYLVETAEGCYLSKRQMTLTQVEALLPNLGLVSVSDEPIVVELEEAEEEQKKAPSRKRKRAVKTSDDEA